jgi:hypothetical protein
MLLAMRFPPLALGLVALAGAAIGTACGSDVNTTSTGSGGSTGSTIDSTTDGAPGTGGSLTTSVTSTTSTSASSTTSTGTGVMCPDTGTACTKCLSQACAPTYCSCYGNLDCSALFECWKTCSPGDTACAQSCESAHQDGISSAFLLSDCAASSCATDCPGTEALPACQKCLFESCDVQMNACVANPECTALFTCAKACNGDMTCVQQCATDHPNGVQDATKVNTCAKVSCTSVCN